MSSVVFHRKVDEGVRVVRPEDEQEGFLFIYARHEGAVGFFCNGGLALVQEDSGPWQEAVNFKPFMIQEDVVHLCEERFIQPTHKISVVGSNPTFIVLKAVSSSL